MGEFRFTTLLPTDYLLSDSVDLNVANGKILSLEVASDDKKNYKNFEKRVQEASPGHRGLQTHMPLFSHCAFVVAFLKERQGFATKCSEEVLATSWTKTWKNT